MVDRNFLFNLSISGVDTGLDFMSHGLVITTPIGLHEKVSISFFPVKLVVLCHAKCRHFSKSALDCGGEVSVCYISLGVSSIGRIITAESQQHMAVGWGEEIQMRTKAQTQK